MISCNPENGNSQYRIVYKNDKNGNVLKGSAIGILFVYILVSNSKSEYIGLYQRMIELVLVTWIIFCAIAIKNIKPAGNNV